MAARRAEKLDAAVQGLAADGFDVQSVAANVSDEAEIQKVVDTEIPPLFDYLEGEIGDEEYLVGNKFSIADIGVATIFVNYAYAGYGVDAKRWPKLAAYINRILSRPSFKGVIDKEKAALGIQ